jgi:hypothetical protein
MIFNNAVSILAVRFRVVVFLLNGKWERIWKEDVVGYECIESEWTDRVNWSGSDDADEKLKHSLWGEFSLLHADRQTQRRQIELDSLIKRSGDKGEVKGVKLK